MNTERDSALTRAMGLSETIMGTRLAGGMGNDEGQLFLYGGGAFREHEAGTRFTAAPATTTPQTENAALNKLNDLFGKSLKKDTKIVVITVITLPKVSGGRDVFHEYEATLHDVLINNPEKTDENGKKIKYISWPKDYPASLITQLQSASFLREYLNPPPPLSSQTVFGKSRDALVRQLAGMTSEARRRWFAEHSFKNDFDNDLKFRLAQEYFIEEYYDKIPSGQKQFEWVRKFKRWPENFPEDKNVVGILRDVRPDKNFPAGKGFLFVLKGKDGNILFSKVYYPQGNGVNNNVTGVWHKDILAQIREDLPEEYRLRIGHINDYNSNTPSLGEGSVQSNTRNIFIADEGSAVHSAEFYFVDASQYTDTVKNPLREFQSGELSEEPEVSSENEADEYRNATFSNVYDAHADFSSKQKKYNDHVSRHNVAAEDDTTLASLKNNRDAARIKLNKIINNARGNGNKPPEVPGYISSFILNELKLDPKRQITIHFEPRSLGRKQYSLEQLLSPDFKLWLLYGKDNVVSFTVDWGTLYSAEVVKIFASNDSDSGEDDYNKLSSDPSLKYPEAPTPSASLDIDELNTLVTKQEARIESFQKQSMREVLKKGAPDSKTLFSVFQRQTFVACIKLINDKEALDEITGYVNKGNYSDIYFCNMLAEKIIKKKLKGGSPQEQRAVASVIYHMINNKGVSDINFNNIYNDFVIASKQKSPFYPLLGNGRADGYFSINNFKSTDEVDQKSYYNQFYDYRDKYSQYDAGLLTVEALEPLNLTPEELLEPPRSVKIFSFFGKKKIEEGGASGPNSDTINQETMPPVEVPGGITLMQLSSGRWMLTGNLLGRVRSTVLSEEEGRNINQIYFNRNRVEEGSVWTGKGKRFESSINDASIGSGVLSLLYDDDSKREILKIMGIVDNHFRFGPWDPKNVGAKDELDEKYNVSAIDKNASGVSVLHQSMNLTNLYWAKTVHNAGNKNSPLWSFVPLHDTIHGALYNREHVFDPLEILFDVLSFIPLGQLGKIPKIGNQVATLLRAGMMIGLKQSLKGKKLLVYAIRYASKEAARLGLGETGLSIVLKSLWDILEPLPMRSPAKGLYRRVNRWLDDTKLPEIGTSLPARLRLGTRPQGTLGDYSGEHEVLNGAYTDPVNNRHYIEVDGHWYRIEADPDPDLHVARIIDPAIPWTGRNSSLHTGVIKNERGEWIVNHQTGAGFGGNNDTPLTTSRQTQSNNEHELSPEYQNAMDHNLSYWEGGRRADDAAEAAIIIKAEDISQYNSEFVSYGRGDAIRKNDLRLIRLYDDLESGFNKTKDRIVKLLGLLEEQPIREEVISHLIKILGVEENLVKKYLIKLKKTLKKSLGEIQNTLDENLSNVWIMEKKNTDAGDVGGVDAVVPHNDLLGRVYVNIDPESSMDILLPHEMSHAGASTEDYFYHSSNTNVVDDIKSDTRSAIMNLEPMPVKTMKKFWFEVDGKSDVVKKIEKILEVDEIKSANDLITAYNNCEDATKKEAIRSLMADWLVDNNNETYINLIANNADTFSHVLLSLDNKFGGE